MLAFRRSFFRTFYEDWHEVALTSDTGERIEFCCYGDLTARWARPQGVRLLVCRTQT